MSKSQSKAVGSAAPDPGQHGSAPELGRASATDVQQGMMTAETMTETKMVTHSSCMPTGKDPLYLSPEEASHAVRSGGFGS